MRVLVAIFLVLLAAARVSAAATCTISGQIVDATGTPIVNGTVNVNSMVTQIISGSTVPPSNTTTKTDANGNITPIAVPQGLQVQVTVCNPKAGGCGAAIPAIIPINATAFLNDILSGVIMPGGSNAVVGSLTVNSNMSVAGTTTLASTTINGLHLPTPLEVVSGGTATTTAPTVGQALVATSTSAYAPTSLSTHNVADIVGPTAFTPAMAGVTTAGTNTYAFQVGYYYIVGHLCTATVGLSLTATSGMTGNLVITGLPPAITSSPNSNEFQSCAVSQWGGIAFAGTGYTMLGGRIDPNSQFIEVIQSGSGQGATNVPSANVNSSGQLLMTCNYLCG